MKVSISRGNEKLGSIQSVSLPSGLTCRECDCSRKCYARRIERRRPSVAAAYRNNLQVLETEPATYWREVEATIMLSRFFRFHVSGDIPNTTMLRLSMGFVQIFLLLLRRWKVVGDAINSAQITLWASGKKSSQVWRSALTQSPHISPNIISVPMANIITAKLLKGSAFGITETPSGQK